MSWDALKLSPAFSLELFRNTVINDRFRLYLLKNLVSTSEHRRSYRLFHGANEGFWSRIGHTISHKTNYAAVCDHLNVFRCADLSYMVDANNPYIDTYLNPLKSTQHLPQLRDKMYNDNHKVLVEEIIFGFTWEPELSKAYLQAKGIIAMVKLTAAVASTVSTLGATGPSIIDSLRSAVDSIGDLVRLYKIADDAKENVKKVAESIGELAGAGKEFAEAREAIMSHGSKPQLIGGSGLATQVDHSSGDPVSQQEVHGVDFAGGRLSDERQEIRHGILRRYREETESEMRRRIGAQAAEEIQERAKLMFVVVQQATPVVIHRDNFDVRGDNILCDLRLSAMKESVIRIGHTDLAKYEAMLTAMTLGHSDTELLIYPWLTEGGYAEHVRILGQSASNMLASPHRGPGGWDTSTDDWITSDPISQHKMPLPQSLIMARAKIQARRQQYRADFREQMNQKLIAAAREAKHKVEQRRLEEERRRLEEESRVRLMELQRANAAQAAMEARQRRERLKQSGIRDVYQAFITSAYPPHQHMMPVIPADAYQIDPLVFRAIDDALRRTTLPGKEAFIESTQIRKLWTHKRNNPALLNLDQFIDDWHARQFPMVYDTPELCLEAYAVRLRPIIEECERYISEKSRKVESGGSESQRLPAVSRLNGSATILMKDLVDIGSAAILLANGLDAVMREYAA